MTRGLFILIVIAAILGNWCGKPQQEQREVDMHDSFYDASDY